MPERRKALFSFLPKNFQLPLPGALNQTEVVNPNPAVILSQAKDLRSNHDQKRTKSEQLPAGNRLIQNDLPTLE
jgi:hypothetical protein